MDDSPILFLHVAPGWSHEGKEKNTKLDITKL